MIMKRFNLFISTLVNICLALAVQTFEYCIAKFEVTVAKACELIYTVGYTMVSAVSTLTDTRDSQTRFDAVDYVSMRKSLGTV